jgi:hypothetical protein
MPSNDLTLAFSLQALEELARPTRAFEDAATLASKLAEIHNFETAASRAI